MIAHVGQTHLRVRGCRQPSWRSGISLPSPFQPPEPASTGTGSPDVAGIAKQGQGGRRAQAMEIANRRWDHRVLSVGASRWRASRHERGTACSSCVTRRGAAHHVCTPRHALTGLANPARTRLRSLRQMSVERDDSLPEQGRRRAFPRLPLVDDGLPCRAHQRGQLRLAHAARATKRANLHIVVAWNARPSHALRDADVLGQ